MTELQKMAVVDNLDGTFSVEGFQNVFGSKAAANEFISKYASASIVTLETDFPLAPNFQFQFRQIDDAYYLFGHQKMHELAGGMFVYSKPEESKSEAQKNYDENPNTNKFFILYRAAK